MRLNHPSEDEIEEMIIERISDSPETFEVIRHPKLWVNYDIIVRWIKYVLSEKKLYALESSKSSKELQNKETGYV